MWIIFESRDLSELNSGAEHRSRLSNLAVATKTISGLMFFFRSANKLRHAYMCHLRAQP